MAALNSIEKFNKWRDDLTAGVDKNLKTITLCGGTGCIAWGTDSVYETLITEIKQRGLEKIVKVKKTGCHGFCEKGPIIVLLPDGIFYPGFKPEHVPEFLEKSVLGGEIIESLLYVDPVSGNRITYEKDIPFYSKQKRIVFRHNGRLDPIDIEDYIIRNGYSALAAALSDYTPNEVVEIVKKSGLRGRGGAGFPTGVKWEFCRKASGTEKYLICNADEGDPGAFMDRSLLEGSPHMIIEGMIIAAYAIGATNGFIYARAEYPLAVTNTKIALKQAREKGLLGDNIFGTDFSFDITIREGAGAFVCGEETALIASLEGRRGMPRSRPPFPAVSGYHGMPTNINNVETFANVPWIIKRGARAYSDMGTETSKGTKIFALAGKINNTGLVEVPMGLSLRQIIMDIGGGIPDGGEFKAAQMGGPSGGCVPAEYLDLPVDFESLKEVGSIMGSGGLIVMDNSTCMVDIAHYFLMFTQEESCGKCVPCRVGTRHMADILKRICDGDGKEDDIKTLEELGQTIKTTSLCALGQTAPNPVLTSIKYFRNEYETHINDKLCPAGVCKGLITYSIEADKCTGCGRCKKSCAANAISGEKKEPHKIDSSKCVKCGLCFDVCNFDAVLIK